MNGETKYKDPSEGVGIEGTGVTSEPHNTHSNNNGGSTNIRTYARKNDIPYNYLYEALLKQQQKIRPYGWKGI